MQQPAPGSPEITSGVASEASAYARLTPTQIQAVDLLAAGVPAGQIADRLGIQRSTVYRWKTQNPAFIAALNRTAQDALDALAIRAAQLLASAINLAQEAVENKRNINDFRVRTALAIISSLGSRRLLAPAGPLTEHAALRDLANQRRRQLHTPADAPITTRELQQVFDELQQPSL